MLRSAGHDSGIEEGLRGLAALTLRHLLERSVADVARRRTVADAQCPCASSHHGRRINLRLSLHEAKPRCNKINESGFDLWDPAKVFCKLRDRGFEREMQSESVKHEWNGYNKSE